MGKAECSAGIYDMIDVDDKAVKKNLKRIESWEKGKKGLGPVLKDTVFFASRMLMVTRGEEPGTRQETYDLFIRLFIETGLVDKTHRLIVELVKDERFCELSDHKYNVVALGKDIIALYKGMDSTMRFSGETENLAIRMEEKLGPEGLEPEKSEPGESETEKPEVKSAPSDVPGERAKEKPDRFKDLRGVKCPLNFAQTKVQIAGMKPGETLEVILDDGEPIENVPGSVKLDGHIVLNQEKIGDHWTVLIEKV
jgi:sulfite reductase (ferredoxin)